MGFESAEFDEIEHTADWAFRVRAADLPGLFVHAALAVYRMGDVALAPGARVERAVRVTGVDHESLLVAWLNELLYLGESEGLAFDELAVERLTDTELVARVRGSRVERWGKYIKAATYNDLEIRQSEKGYEVTVVVDV